MSGSYSELGSGRVERIGGAEQERGKMSDGDKDGGFIETTLRYLQTGRCSDLNACWSVGKLVLVNLKSQHAAARRDPDPRSLR